MKSHHLSITTLEEHESNREFVGRNFNAGEIIQLVLRSQKNGAWLSFRTVQMVMMHELAHCVQMNHSRQFWGVRNAYAEELRGLWARGYSGDGLWGRGQTLLSGEYDRGGRGEGDVLPEHLCGGAYRRRRAGGRKRKRGLPSNAVGEETYAERKQRRIAKKFGVSGQPLGGDHETRVKLEYGQVVKGKPRVAQSARGRELRVAAALARFGQQKNEDGKAEPPAAVGGDEKEEDLLSGEEEDDASNDEAEGSMIKVCGSEDGDDVDVKHEMDELRDLDSCLPESYNKAADDAETTGDEDNRIADERPQEYSNESQLPNNDAISAEADTTDDDDEEGHKPSRNPSNENPLPQNHDVESRPPRPPFNEGNSPLNNINCPICSMENPHDSPLCQACSHVLKPDLIPNHWRCQSAECKDSAYLNNGDSGLCGVCGGRKPSG